VNYKASRFIFILFIDVKHQINEAGVVITSSVRRCRDWPKVVTSYLMNDLLGLSSCSGSLK